MPGDPSPFRIAAFLAAALAFVLARTGIAAAFPLLDPTNEATVQGTAQDLAAPDAQALQHQLQLTNAFGGAPSGGGWTILPRLGLQEVFNDNVLQVNTPRRAGLTTLISPGVSVLGDLPRIQTTFDYAPALELNVPEGSQNALIQQLNGTGLITLDPDYAFVDITAFAGAQAANGLVGSNGATGGFGAASAGSTLGSASNTIGIARQNRTQTSSFTVAPYLMHTFGEYGTGKLGVSGQMTNSDLTTGFATAPFPSGGAQGTSELTTQEIGEFNTGNYFDAFQDTISVNITQTTTNTNQVVSATGATATIPNTRITSSNEILSDKVAYAVTHTIDVFATFGHEHIQYSTVGFRTIDDFTWSVGTTLQPTQDSDITLSYGHQQGTNSIAANAHYAVTARTTLTASYTNTIGTELQELGEQLDAAVVGPNGQFVNGTNGQPLLVPVYTTISAPEVFRYRTLNIGVQTVMDRDSLSLTTILSDQNSVSINSRTSSEVKSVSLTWEHDLSPDLRLASSASYTTQSGTGELCPLTLAAVCTATPNGSSRSLLFGATLTYTINDTLTASLQYLFNDRSSPVAADNMYQDLVIVGVTKQF